MKNKLFTLPNVVTLANLACGCAAIVCVGADQVSNRFFWFIAAAAAFDFLDGAAARLTGQYSEVGKQLDSLADVVSFGVAPSMALFSAYGHYPTFDHATSWPVFQILGWSVFTVALFSALRLAKFNVDETQREEFTGLPTPAAALAIASLHWMWCGHLWSDSLPPETALVTAAIISYLLVSPIRMFSLKFKNFGWRGNELRYTFLALSSVLIAVLGIGGVAAAVGVYVLLSTVRHLAGMRRAAKN